MHRYLASILFLFASMLQAATMTVLPPGDVEQLGAEPVSFTVTPETTTMPVTGGDDSVTVCVEGLVAGQLVGVDMPMRHEDFRLPAIYQQQVTPIFDSSVVCFVFPIPGTSLGLPGVAAAETVIVIVQEEDHSWRQIQGPGLIVTGPDPDLTQPSDDQQPSMWQGGGWWGWGDEAPPGRSPRAPCPRPPKRSKHGGKWNGWTAPLDPSKHGPPP